MENIIKEFAETENFTLKDAKEIIELFIILGKEKIKNKTWKPIYQTRFDDVKYFIKEWDDSWYRFYNWSELLDSEIEQGTYGLTEDECKEQLGKSIFELSSGMYVQSMV